MEKFALDDASYRLLKELDLSEMENKIVFDDKENTFFTDDVNLLLIIITENIASNGMDAEQETCTEYGRSLYTLHDEILYK